MLKLVHYSDAGHGWVKVARSVLAKYNLLEKISACSYQSETGTTVYLEEDGDASALLGFLKQNNIAYQMESKSTDRTSPIRSYARFSAIQKPLVDLTGQTIDLYGKRYQVSVKVGRNYSAVLLATGQRFKIGPKHANRATVVSV